MFLFNRKSAVFVVATFIVLILPARGSSQTNEVQAKLLRASDESTEELKVGDEWVRGKEIGEDKFKPCKGQAITKKNRPIRKSDKCHEPGNPTGFRPERVIVVGWDARSSFLALKIPGDARTYRLYVPDSTLLVKDRDAGPIKREEFGWLDSSRPREMIIFRDIAERVEGIALPDSVPDSFRPTPTRSPQPTVRQETIIQPDEKDWPKKAPPILVPRAPTAMTKKP